MIFLGIDPGVASGALAAVDECGGFVLVEDAPWLASGAGGRKEPDYRGLAELLAPFAWKSEQPIRAFVEEIRPHGGPRGPACPACKRPRGGLNALSVASMVSSSTAWRALLAFTGVPMEVVTPRAWRKAIGLPTVAGQSAIEKRDAVLAKARALWPTAPLERAKDNGRAAALLIAEAGRRMSRGAAA